MKQLWWCLPFVLVVGCRCQSEKPSTTHLELNLDESVRLELSKAPPILTVKLSRPSTLFVLQDSRVRFLFHWPSVDKDGEVTIPLGQLSAHPLGHPDADSPGPDHSLFITLTRDPSITDPGPGPKVLSCVACARGLQKRYAAQPELVERLRVGNWCCPTDRSTTP